MDTRTGRLYEQAPGESLAELAERESLSLDHLMKLETPPTVRQRIRMRIGAYDPCPCGSGKKFKFCCHGKRAVSEGAKT